MENLLYNLDSTESSYGESILTSVIQVDERIGDIEGFFDPENKLNDFERTEVNDRLNKLIQLNATIQMELERQAQRLKQIKQSVGTINADFDPQSISRSI